MRKRNSEKIQNVGGKNKCEAEREKTGTNTAIKANGGGGSRQHADGCACSSFYYVRISCRLQSVLVNREIMEVWVVPQHSKRKFCYYYCCCLLSLILQLLLYLIQTHNEKHKKLVPKSEITDR